MWYTFNYFLIGVIFTFIVDLFLSTSQNNPTVKDISEDWHNEQRIACVVLWPIGVLWFIISFIKHIFK
tara:strand:+ start:376 stop:579 length:204 start_codon:yes stop_codon:yes gene_type:complete